MFFVIECDMGADRKLRDKTAPVSLSERVITQLECKYEVEDTKTGRITKSADYKDTYILRYL